MSVWLTFSRAILGVAGGLALLLVVGNLATGGEPITNPTMVYGLVFGALTFGAATWTSSPERWKAIVVWLGVLAVVVTFFLFLRSVGDAALRDVIVYFGIPAAVVLLATVTVAIARSRSGPLGT